MITLRTEETEKAYRKALSKYPNVDLRLEPAILDFKYFKIINNSYPHDRIASTHHLLIPKRKINSWHKLRWYERKEFKKIDIYASAYYDCIKRNYPSQITVPHLVHWHLYILKK